MKEKITTKQIAEQLRTTKNVILAIAKKCLPNKKIEKYKTTYFDEKEVSIIINHMKKVENSSQNRSVKLTEHLKTVKTNMIIKQEAQESLNNLKQLPIKDKIQASLLLQQDIIKELNNQNIQLQQENKQLKDKNKIYINGLKSFINLADKEYEEENDKRTEKNKKLYWWIE